MRGLILALAFATPAAAQTCAPYDAVSAALASSYGETLQTRALARSGYMLEIWANTETGTWTALAIGPDMIACQIDDGDAFELHAIPQGERM